MKKNTHSIPSRTLKRHPVIYVLKWIMMILTVVLSVFIVCMVGAGLIYNHKSYGTKLTVVGILFILSGIFMVTGGVLACIKKNIASLSFTVSGFALCMYMLYLLADHADRSGWSDKYTMSPISDMYISRVIPVIIPVVLAVFIALVQFFSYEAAEARREKRRLKKEKENEPAPPII
ncbi:MAG: hypothetical protein E7497_00775 [Ruminococcus sp.]|nr:hypothetical protein [Ruminococcus sp.]